MSETTAIKHNDLSEIVYIPFNKQPMDSSSRCTPCKPTHTDCIESWITTISPYSLDMDQRSGTGQILVTATVLVSVTLKP